MFFPPKSQLSKQKSRETGCEVLYEKGEILSVSLWAQYGVKHEEDALKH